MNGDRCLINVDADCPPPLDDKDDDGDGDDDSDGNGDDFLVKGFPQLFLHNQQARAPLGKKDLYWF